MVNKKFIDIAGLTRYNENLKTVLSKKQDVIEDLEDIRKNASDAAGAAADAAAQALADAKADAAEKYQVKGDYEAAGTAAGLNEAMDARMQAVEAREVYVSATVNQAITDAKDAAIADAAEKYQVKGEYETAGAAAQALVDAKADAASLYQVKGDYEEAGAAAQALADAKADAASLYQVKGDYEVAGTAAGLNAAMDARMQAVEGREVYVSATVNQAIADAKDAALADAKTYADGLNTAMDDRVKDLEAIDHEKLAADASAAAVATVLDDAPEKFDTLKEVAEWISNNESASSAADLVTRVAALEAIDHDAYVAADEVVLNSAKSYADGLASNYDEAGAAAQALADAKAYTDGKVDGKFDAAGAADAALASAKAYTDTEVAKKQDIIEDLATIREGAAAGATALQEDDLQFATDSEIDALFA